MMFSLEQEQQNVQSFWKILTLTLEQTMKHGEALLVSMETQR